MGSEDDCEKIGEHIMRLKAVLQSRYGFDEWYATLLAMALTIGALMRCRDIDPE